MDMSTYGAIRACLPDGRTLFHYERDRYAVFLLEHLLKAGWTAREIKNSRYAKLLSAPPVRDYLAELGSLELDAEMLSFVPFKSPQSWRLTLSKWGTAENHSWNQTSCRGTNLVLQLNFPVTHNREFDALLTPGARRMFEY